MHRFQNIFFLRFLPCCAWASPKLGRFLAITFLRKQHGSNVSKNTAKPWMSCCLGKSACKKKREELKLQDKMIIQRERDLGSSPVQPPDESRVNQEARPSLSGLFTASSWKPPNTGTLIRTQLHYLSILSRKKFFLIYRLNLYFFNLYP